MSGSLSTQSVQGARPERTSRAGPADSGRPLSTPPPRRPIKSGTGGFGGCTLTANAPRGGQGALRICGFCLHGSNQQTENRVGSRKFAKAKLELITQGSCSLSVCTVLMSVSMTFTPCRVLKCLRGGAECEENVRSLNADTALLHVEDWSPQELGVRGHVPLRGHRPAVSC